MHSIISTLLELALFIFSTCLVLLVLLIAAVVIGDTCEALAKWLKPAYSRWRGRSVEQVRVDVNESATPLPPLLARPIAVLIAEEKEQYEKFAPARARWRERYFEGVSKMPRVNPKTVISLIVFAFVSVLTCLVAPHIPLNPWLKLGIVLFSGGLICALLTALHLIGEIRSVRAYRQSGGRWWPNEPWSERVAALELLKTFRKDLEDLRTRSNAWMHHHAHDSHAIAGNWCRLCWGNSRVTYLMECLEEDTDRLECLLRLGKTTSPVYRGAGHTNEIEDLLQRMRLFWKAVEDVIRPRDTSPDARAEEFLRQKDESQNTDEVAHQERRRSS